jgi:phospholipid/cholesterol/gamma-HCH transport system permease protein
MTGSPSNLRVEMQSPDAVLVRLAGDFRQQIDSFTVGAVRDALDRIPQAKSLSFASTTLTGWDSRFVAFARKCAELCRTRNIEFRDDGFPEGVRRLLRLAQAVPERTDARHVSVETPLLQEFGEGVIQAWGGTLELFTFLGENLAALGKLVRNQAQFRWSDTLLVMQECGPQALGIVALINFLVGLILAFVGAIELSRFGASIRGTGRASIPATEPIT